MRRINAKYKLLALVPLVMIGGCKKIEHEHKNVITGIGSYDNKKMIMLNDVDTDQERILFFNRLDADTSFYKYFRLDDTVKIITGGVYSGDGYYQDNTILYQDAIGLQYNIDTICARHEHEENNKTQQINTFYQRTR